MKRFLLALLLPIIVVGALTWRTLTTIIWLSLLPPPATAAQAAQPQVDNTLSIPSIGLTTPVISSKIDPTSLGDWKQMRQDLTQGVSLAEKLSPPGESGITVITGHSSDWTPHQYAAVFAGLNYLHTGDIIQLRYRGQSYRYAVHEKLVVLPNDPLLSTTHLKEPTDRSQLYLVTCWPLLTTQKRLVVTAVLVQ